MIDLFDKIKREVINSLLEETDPEPIENEVKEKVKEKAKKEFT